jgi:hypothetical protein
MSRKEKYSEEYLTKLWADFQASNKKLKEFCKEGNLNYISIYTALRKKGIMTFLKKGTKPKATTTATVATPEPAKV